MTDKIGNGSMPLRIGNLIHTVVYGGPYRDVPNYFFGVKMAEEIDHPHMVDIPTRDFDVPKVSDLKVGIVKTLMGMINDENVYVGCMGGIGRTGIFLAALAKVQIEYRKFKHRPGRGEDPVLYVRKHFIPHAVETEQQMQYIADLDVSSIVEWLNVTQVAMGLGGVTPAADSSLVKTVKERISDPQIIDVELAELDRPIDADCVSLPNGDCIAEVECLHGPATERYRTGYKERYANWREESNEEYQHQTFDEFADTDSVDPVDLQAQIWGLEERMDRQFTELTDNVNMRFETTKELLRMNFYGEDWEDKPDKPLTKQSWREKIKNWIKDSAYGGM